MVELSFLLNSQGFFWRLASYHRARREVGAYLTSPIGRTAVFLVTLSFVLGVKLLCNANKKYNSQLGFETLPCMVETRDSQVSFAVNTM